MAGRGGFPLTPPPPEGPSAAISVTAGVPSPAVPAPGSGLLRGPSPAGAGTYRPMGHGPQFQVSGEARTCACVVSSGKVRKQWRRKCMRFLDPDWRPLNLHSYDSHHPRTRNSKSYSPSYVQVVTLRKVTLEAVTVWRHVKRLAAVAGASVSIRGKNYGHFFREGGTLKKLNIRGRISGIC